jgi:anaerobic ribonucleoside-triphosphate reductase activating protein
MDTLRLHAKLERSWANGPGTRSVVWVQGCTLGCVGCFNPETHDRDAASENWTVSDLVSWVVRNDVDGLTISGGEPLQQSAAVLALGQACRQRGLSTIVFSGYSKAELETRFGAAKLSASFDAVVTGRFRQDARTSRGFLASDNQTLWLLTQRHTETDFADVPDAEVVVRGSGEVVVTGITVPALEKLSD